jgi:hypothetical protein
VDKRLVERVKRRARYACEYCRLPQANTALPFHIDHVIARQHSGRTIPSHLALTCARCNRFKGPNLAGIDPVTGRLTPLFHPRRQKWDRHFRWAGPVLVGRTRAGRTTVAVLTINAPYRVAERQALIKRGLFPP